MHWRKSSHGITRTLTAVIVIVVIVIVAVAGYAAISLTSTSSSTTTTSSSSSTTSSSSAAPVQSSWIIDFTPSGLQMPVYVAQAKGFFAAQGVQMNIISNPQGSVGAVQAVASGKAEFGDADFGTFIATSLKNNITNVRIVGGWVQNGAGAGVIYLKGKGINTIQDLQGKVIGSFTGDSDESLFKVFAAKNGLNMSSITINHVSVSALEPGLLNGQFAGILLYKQHLAELTPLAAQHGDQVGFFDYADYGLSSIYGQSVITTTSMIQNNPQLVTKVLTAFYQGVQYSFKNPQDAVNSMSSIVSGMNSTLILAQFQTYYSYYIANSTQIVNYANPLYVGWINPTTAAGSITIVSQAYGFTAPDASTIYTNQFVSQPP